MKLANVFTELDDMNSSSKAEDLFKEALEEYAKLNNEKLAEKAIKAKDDLAKFYLKQEKIEVN